MITAFIITFPWYANKLNFLIKINLVRFVSSTSKSVLSTISNIFFYLVFLINYQLGFLNFVILILVGIFFSVRYYKQRRIDERDLLLFLIFLIPYIFYTFIPLKNYLVTTPFLIPLSFIIARGILKFPKTLKYVLLFIVIIVGLFYSLPIQSFNRTITIDLSIPLWVKTDFSNKEIIQTSRINILSKKDMDISLLFSKNSKFYTFKDQQQIKDISKIIYSVLITKNKTKVDVFFLYNDFYIYPYVLDYYLDLVNISSESFSYSFNNFYNTLNIPTKIIYQKNQEDDFEWIYNFDFLIVPEMSKKSEPNFPFFSENYYAIFLYLTNSERFKKNFKLIYQSNVSDKEIVELYEHKNLN